MNSDNDSAGPSTSTANNVVRPSIKSNLKDKIIKPWLQRYVARNPGFCELLNSGSVVTILEGFRRVSECSQPWAYEYCKYVNSRTKTHYWKHHVCGAILNSEDDLFHHWESSCGNRDSRGSGENPSILGSNGEPTRVRARGNFSRNSFLSFNDVFVDQKDSAFAITALVFAHHYGVTDRFYEEMQNLDECTWVGSLYSESLSKSGNQNYDGLKIFDGVFCCEELRADYKISIQERHTSLEGVLSRYPEGDLELRRALDVFVESKFQFAVLTVSDLSVALIKSPDNSFIYTIDFNPTDRCGDRAVEGAGGACITRFNVAHLYYEIARDITNKFLFEREIDLDLQRVKYIPRTSSPFRVIRVSVL